MAPAVCRNAPAAAATAVAVPEGMDSGDVVKALKSRFAEVIANGQGEMKGKIFRIAHLGFFDYLDTVALMAALEHVARETLKLPVEWGAGVAEAQKVFAKN
jgi:aspartate aminotransferase-like enzyme